MTGDYYAYAFDENNVPTKAKEISRANEAFTVNSNVQGEDGVINVVSGLYKVTVSGGSDGDYTVTGSTYEINGELYFAEGTTITIKPATGKTITIDSENYTGVEGGYTMAVKGSGTITVTVAP